MSEQLDELEALQAIFGADHVVVDRDSRPLSCQV